MGKGQRKAEAPLGPRTFRVTIPRTCQGCRAPRARPGVGMEGTVNPWSTDPGQWCQGLEQGRTLLGSPPKCSLACQKSSPFGSRWHPSQTRCFSGRDSPSLSKPCSPCSGTGVVHASPSLSWGRRCRGLVVGREEHAASRCGCGWVASSFRLWRQSYWGAWPAPMRARLITDQKSKCWSPGVAGGSYMGQGTHDAW